MPLGEKTLESSDGNGTINVSAATSSLTRMSANPAADAGQRVGIAGKFISFLESPFSNKGDVASCVGVGRTSHHAGEIGVQPIPVDLFVFVPFQQDGCSRCLR
jgi:hypothetical protein